MDPNVHILYLGICSDILICIQSIVLYWSPPPLFTQGCSEVQFSSILFCEVQRGVGGPAFKAGHVPRLSYLNNWQMSYWGDSPQSISFIVPQIRSNKRIGPHNKEVIYFIYGAQQSDAHCERHGNGYRVTLQQESSNREFQDWYYKYQVYRGYCSKSIPPMKYRIGKNCKKRFYSVVRTYTFSSFSWIYDSFYINGKKVIPKNQETYLTPLGLAIWIMGEGTKVSAGQKQCTNGFTYSDQIRCCEVLKHTFGQHATVQKAGNNLFHIYIHKKSMSRLALIVRKEMIHSMHYKLNGS